MVSFDALKPDTDYGRGSRRDAVTTRAEDGPVLRRQLDPDEIGVWRLRWELAGQGQATALRRVYRESLGGVLSGSYTPIEGGGARQVQIVPGSCRITRRGPDNYSLAIDLEEHP